MYELVHESSLWMLSTDVALEFPRPTLPNVVYVGGILTKPASPLPEDLQTWVNGANENGFVLVSFGAGVKYLPEDIADKLAHALARLPQRVIWRFSGKNPRNLGNNTKLIEWLPQNDLLGDSNIKAFLSHGGLNSIFETMYHGVPVVGIPLFGDHYDTMTRVQAKGMGILLNWKTLTEDELYNALVKVINNPSYRRQARKLSEIHKDQPAHPVNRTPASPRAACPAPSPPATDRSGQAGGHRERPRPKSPAQQLENTPRPLAFPVNLQLASPCAARPVPSPPA
ncbi:2-hydroxyacylsphingosine 1-beta-galactosyltransferase [Crotalus adamanteus]|uniref:UDP-glucuronosyltransferase n=1 Tax=Crotalus adamanteus TaxID=8729 RepID=A0AAW1B9X8_CROAD